MQYDNDYQEGFRQGLRAVCGNDTRLPVLVDVPACSLGRTPFQVGLISGIERGKGWRQGSLLAANIDELADNSAATDLSDD